MGTKPVVDFYEHGLIPFVGALRQTAKFRDDNNCHDESIGRLYTMLGYLREYHALQEYKNPRDKFHQMINRLVYKLSKREDRYFWNELDATTQDREVTKFETLYNSEEMKEKRQAL